MSETVVVTLKVGGRIRALMSKCAKADRRTLSAYVETLIVKDAEKKGIDIARSDETNWSAYDR